MHQVSFLLLHLFCSFIDTITRLFSWLLGRGAKGAGSVTVVASETLTEMFHLNQFHHRRYADPPYNGHVATILCAFRPSVLPPFKREVHPGGDGNPICVDWFYSATDSNRVVLIVPGLASSSKTNYIVNFVQKAHTEGIHCCVFNSRGLGDTPLEKPRLMSAKYTDDLRSVVRGVLSKKALSERFNKEVTLFAAGFSLGGVILSKFVGEECLNKEAFNIQCVLVVNSPLDAVKANDVMDRPINRVLYQPHMSKGLVRYALRHRHLLKDIPLLPPHVQQCFANGNYDEIFKQVKSVSDFDAVINAPANGYDNPIEYYKDITPLKWIPHITVPVLCISAADDPTCGTFPFEPFRRMMDRSDNIGYILFPHGGHLGYVGSPLKEWRGLPNMLEETLCTIIHSYNAA